jgi:hypothetical protein
VLPAFSCPVVCLLSVSYFTAQYRTRSSTYAAVPRYAAQPPRSRRHTCMRHATPPTTTRMIIDDHEIEMRSKSTMAFNSAISWGQQPIAYFMAGVLVPTLTYFYLTRTGGRHSSIPVVDPQDGEWDDSDSDEEGDDAARWIDRNNPSAAWSIIDAPYKMVLCVNTSLGMGKGE